MSNDFDVNSLLDGTLDDLADKPEFKPYPAGTHVVTVNLIDKTAEKDRVNKHPGFELKMKLIETLEQVDTTETPSKPGDETSVLYLLDNEMGQGSFKNIMKAAAESFGSKSNRELIADLQNTTCVVVTKQRTNKDKTQTYTDIVELKVA